MDQLEQFLLTVQSSGVATGRLRGLLYVLVGMRIAQADGKILSAGVNWRTASVLLRKAKWDREAVRELGIDPKELSPRDRDKFWFTAINRANLTSLEAKEEALQLVPLLRPLGYLVES